MANLNKYIPIILKKSFAVLIPLCFNFPKITSKSNKAKMSDINTANASDNPIIIPPMSVLPISKLNNPTILPNNPSKIPIPTIIKMVF